MKKKLEKMGRKTIRKKKTIIKIMKKKKKRIRKMKIKKLKKISKMKKIIKIKNLKRKVKNEAKTKIYMLNN